MMVFCSCRPALGKDAPALRHGGFTLIEMAVVVLILAVLGSLLLPRLSGTTYAAACQATDASLATVRGALMGTDAAPGYLSDMGDLPHYLDNALPPNRYDTLHFLYAPSLDVTAGAVTTTYYANGATTPAHPLLRFNPVTRRGWHGPYLLNGAVAAGQSAVLDSFQPRPCAAGDCRNPIVLQIPTGNTHAGACPGLTVAGSNFARLVSAGPDGVLDTALDDAGACARNDDRVLFLKAPDPGRNRPCGD